MSDLKLNLERPEHGWVPVKLECQDKVIEFESSDVPNNPIQGLIDALWKIICGDSSEVWWNLEPDEYFFTFERNNDNIIFRVFFAENSEEYNRREILCVEGEINKIVLPMWRGLKRFLLFNAVEQHWPEISSKEVIKLGDVLEKEAKNG